MTLAEIRRLFVERVGRYDLVADYYNGDYSDAGADYFIRAGVRWLERHAPDRLGMAWYRRNIRPGTFKVELEGVRAIYEVWVVKNTKLRLVRTTLRNLREKFPGELGTRAVGTVTITTNPEPDGDDALTIGDEEFVFVSSREGPMEVEVGSSRSQTAQNLASAINSDSGVVSAVVAESGVGVHVIYKWWGTSGNEVAFTASGDWGSLDGGGKLGGTLAGSNGTIPYGTPGWWAPLVVRPSPAQRNLEDYLFRSEFDRDWQDLSFGRWSEVEGVIFLPPADEEMTVAILGLFESKLETDSDRCVWTVRYPELVVKAAALALEQHYRNTTGAREWREALADDIAGITADEIEHELGDMDMVLGG